jgi:hypothetical protein
MVARRRAGFQRNLVVVEKMGEIYSSMSSTTRMASSHLPLPTRQQLLNLQHRGLSDQSSELDAPHRQVVHPRRLGDGQRLQSFAEREPVSTLLLFLGGIAWRTPTSGGSDTQGLDHLEFFCIRVFYVKWRSFYSNIRFLRARDERTPFQILYMPRLMDENNLERNRRKHHGSHAAEITDALRYGISSTPLGTTRETNVFF